MFTHIFNKIEIVARLLNLAILPLTEWYFERISIAEKDIGN